MNKVNTLPWPGNTPNLNPIENLWSIIKRKLKGNTITSKTEHIATLIRIWYRDEEIENTCKTLTRSMPNGPRKERDAHKVLNCVKRWLNKVLLTIKCNFSIFVYFSLIIFTRLL